MERSEYQARRKKLFDAMEDNSIAIIPTALEVERNRDNPFPFRPNNDFYYFTGFKEPDAIALFVKASHKTQFILFNKTRNINEETWTGYRAGLEGAKATFGADEAFDIASFDEKLQTYLADQNAVYFSFDTRPDIDAVLTKTLEQCRRQQREGHAPPKEIIDVSQIIHEMRLFKSPLEIDYLRQSARISADAHLKLMQACKPDMYEYELEALFRYECIRHGSRELAYPVIAASGPNACILHYTENVRRMKKGELILVDAGSEYHYYASDITRTYPVSGKFSSEQKAIYDIVLAAQEACLEKITIGTSFNALSDVVTRKITEGLIDIGILKGSLDENLEEKLYKPFYMHRQGHWLGLDTHDVGNYQIDNEWRPLAPNMVMTVEPGIYIADHHKDVDKRWHNIGVRIEDDILVTQDGYENLSEQLPKKTSDIEAIMASK